MKDKLDNHEGLRIKKQVPTSARACGSTKGMTEIHLGDHSNTTIFCSKNKDPKEVERQYRKHLNLP